MSQRDDLRHDYEHDCNPSRASPFHELLSLRLKRREVLAGGAGIAAGLAVLSAGCSSNDGEDRVLPPPPKLGFQPVPVGRADTVTLPEGYQFQALARAGQPITGSRPAFRGDLSNTAAEMAQQVGHHHDGMRYYPLPFGSNASDNGLLLINHEYVDFNFLHADRKFDAANNRHTDDDVVRKEIAAHGVSVVEIRKGMDGRWSEVVDSPFNRRITGATPMAIRGPARGHAKMVTAYSPDGTATRGTLNNCGNGYTPWGTYLTCEENFHVYFVTDDATAPREQTRMEIRANPLFGNYRWHTAPGGSDDTVRFDASIKAASAAQDYRNESNTFGWIVEIDPYNPDSTPVKRTSMGRFSHEGAWPSPARAGKPLAFYLGDDKANEYFYKFVTREVWRESDRNAGLVAGNRYLDVGSFYVAKFNADGTGEWIELSHGQNGLTAANGFADQGDVVINARSAADAVGATPMDRPEWAAVHPNGDVYFTLTNNGGRSNPNAANPRAPNPTGHIIKLVEEGGEPSATRFTWSIFVLSGTAADHGAKVLPGQAGERPLDETNLHASPDGLWVDERGILWIQTDMSGNQLNQGPFGNNQMLAAEPETGLIRRFLVGPPGCEVTGIDMTPDGRTMFVNIQHPGDNRPGTSHFPDGGTAVPRSCTVVVTRRDGGVIGL